jgi:hypothetical protein
MNFFNVVNMVLQKQTSSGLNYGQVLATITILISLLGIALQANMRMEEIEISQRTSLIRIEKLEEGKIINAESILRLENKNTADHARIDYKLDQVLIELSHKK